MEDELIITSGNGAVYSYNYTNGSMKEIFYSKNDNEYFMGVSKYKDKVIVSSNYVIYVLEEYNNAWICNRYLSWELGKGDDPTFQHVKIIGGKLFAPSLVWNCIDIIDLELDDYSLKPSFLYRVSILQTGNRTYYDHINCIFFYKDRYIINSSNLCRNTSSSGIIIADNLWNPINSYEYGYNTYGTCVLDDKLYYLCNFDREINLDSGLVVGKEMVVKAGNYSLRDFSINNDNIFIVGSAILNEHKFDRCGGILIVLDRNFKHLDTIFFPSHGQFMGCMLRNYDLTNEMWNMENLGIENWTVGYTGSGKDKFIKIKKLDTKSKFVGIE